MNYSVGLYNRREYAVFCARSRCFIIFGGGKKKLQKRADELNKGGKI